MIQVTPQLAIDESEFQISFVQASGPGGQNVNKVSTAAQLRFDVANSPALPDAVRGRLLRLAGKRITSEGILVLEARRFRTQEANRREVLRKLEALIQLAVQEPRVRRKTSPTPVSKERRLRSKRRRSQVKRLRRSTPAMDE